jgi:allophanate hydrolase
VLRENDSLDFVTLRRRYQAGTLRPTELVDGILARIERRGEDKVWLHVLSRKELRHRAAELERRGPGGFPLYGLPFAIKDNIDLAGHPTTAACPAYAYVPGVSAAVVQKLIDAGALAIGKTNLDQFATGLVGTRSPYGACANAFDDRYIAGGSSSGSAVAVSAGLVSFSLGTDTAGSGRVPAAFNNIVGLKPSRGLLSTRGVVPACRSVDCVSIFALTTPDAWDVFSATRGFDADDPFSRPGGQGTEAAHGCKPSRFRFAVPAPGQLEFFGNDHGRELFVEAQRRLEQLGGSRIEIDFRPFLEAGRLLYEGPWVAERYLAVQDLIERRPEALYPVTRQVIEGGRKFTARDGFAAFHRLKALARETASVWQEADVLLAPTAARLYTLAQVEAEPLALNRNLGYYTNFANLLDLSALAVPAGFQPDALPFGVTLIGPVFEEPLLCAIGDSLHRSLRPKLGATGCEFPSEAYATADAQDLSELGSWRIFLGQRSH